MQMAGQPIPLEEVQKKLEHYCAYQERCHQEVILKLKSYGVFGDPIDRIISHLIQQNYLNETRFSIQFVRGKFNQKKWGKKRLTSALKQRNISDWNINNALKEISDASYEQCAQTLAEKFWNKNPDQPLALRKQKVWNAMEYRGWETALIMENILRLEHQKL